MGKIVLDEKEVNELMDTFDFNKSVYLQKLQELTRVIDKLDDIQTIQKQITDDLIQFKPILLKLQDKDEKEVIDNYSLYLSFLAQKIEDLGKNEDLKQIQKIINLSDKIVSLSVLKVVLIVAVITTALNFLILK
ncbi:hypothetical protein N5U22_07060 [Aliarcobacter cryaerophilus]|uniref:hypothetical protein n=1 Tax=Aliarcobacter cryaerophilus TaxID=28198 RepID=UPI0021B5073A|nr:hypothetical protein [Aliarcobacter cryaerophilus]MCT7533163.1 hypothetical protein [Aliarcobacter cryaerophilus]